MKSENFKFINLKSQINGSDNEVEPHRFKLFQEVDKIGNVQSTKRFYRAWAPHVVRKIIRKCNSFYKVHLMFKKQQKACALLRTIKYTCLKEIVTCPYVSNQIRVSQIKLLSLAFSLCQSSCTHLPLGFCCKGIASVAYFLHFSLPSQQLRMKKKKDTINQKHVTSTCIEEIHHSLFFIRPCLPSFIPLW